MAKAKKDAAVVTETAQEADLRRVENGGLSRTEYLAKWAAVEEPEAEVPAELPTEEDPVTGEG